MLEFLKERYKLVISFLIEAVVIAVLFIISCRICVQEIDLYFNLVVLITGFAVGSLIGIFLSPFDPAEKRTFSTFAKAMSAFVSGYLLAKADPLITNLFSVATASNTLVAFRLMAFMSMAANGLIFVYVFRKYA